MSAERQKPAIYLAILVLLANLSLSITTQSNINRQNPEKAMGFHQPILLLENSNSLNVLTAERRQSMAAGYFRAVKVRIAPTKDGICQAIFNNNYIFKKKLLTMFENYKLEGG